MNIKISSVSFLLTYMLFTSTAYALGKCSVKGSVHMIDEETSTAVTIQTIASGEMSYCQEDDGSWGSWDLAFAIAEIFKGAETDGFYVENRLYLNDWEQWLEHDVMENVLSVEFNLVLNAYGEELKQYPDYPTMYCVRGSYGVYNLHFDDMRFGQSNYYCGKFGIYQDTTGGGGGTNDPPCQMFNGALPESCYNDPLLIDLGQDGVHLGGKGIRVAFDINARGQKEFIQWVAANGNEAFLVRDINGNGQIDDGSELFGNGTVR